MTNPELIHYPAGALLRVSQICRNPRTGAPGFVPWVRETWLRKAKAGEVPAGRKIGAKTRVWTVEEVLGVCASLGATEGPGAARPVGLQRGHEAQAERTAARRSARAQAGGIASTDQAARAPATALLVGIVGAADGPTRGPVSTLAAV